MRDGEAEDAAEGNSDPFDFRADKFVGDLINASTSHFGDAFDALESALDKWETAAGKKVLRHNVETLFRESHGVLTYFMDRMELYALGTIFHVPEQLLHQGSQSRGQDTKQHQLEQQVGEEEIKALEGVLEEMRSEIVTARASTRFMRMETSAIDAELQRTCGMEALQSMGEAGSGSNVVDEAKAVVGLAGRLEDLLGRTQELLASSWSKTRGDAGDLEEAIRRRMRQVGASKDSMAKLAARSKLPR